MGAKEVKFEGVHVLWDEATTPQSKQPSIRQTKASEEKAIQIEENSNIQENADHTDEQLSLMMVEDPFEYERLLRERELEDAQTGEAYN